MCHALSIMSAQDIITELSHLSRPELEKVDAHLHELLRGNSVTSSRSWGEALIELAGTAEGLPSLNSETLKSQNAEMRPGENGNTP